MRVCAWCQVASLSGYKAKVVRRAMHSAMIRSWSTTHHDATKCVSFVIHILRRVPMPKCCCIKTALNWIRGHCHWDDNHYATRRLLEGFAIDGILWDWSSDQTTLREY